MRRQWMACPKCKGPGKVKGKQCPRCEGKMYVEAVDLTDSEKRGKMVTR